MRGTFLKINFLTMCPSSIFVIECLFYFLSRLAKYQAFKSFSKRILVATDLFGRGMDIERVNIVFNYDMPENSDTYLHRVRTTIMLKKLCRENVSYNKGSHSRSGCVQFMSEILAFLIVP